MTFKSIVAPVDGSASSNAAIKLAIAVAKDAGATLVFCHAVRIPRPAHDAGGFAREQIMEEETKTAHEILETARKEAANAGIDAQAVMLAYPVVEAILDCVKEQHADLIIMGTHGHSAMRRAVLGSTTADVIGRATVPVMVAPPVHA